MIERNHRKAEIGSGSEIGLDNIVR
jgi:hypothetical protein